MVNAPRPNNGIPDINGDQSLFNLRGVLHRLPIASPFERQVTARDEGVLQRSVEAAAAAEHVSAALATEVAELLRIRTIDTPELSAPLSALLQTTANKLSHVTA